MNQLILRKVYKFTVYIASELYNGVKFISKWSFVAILALIVISAFHFTKVLDCAVRYGLL